MGLVNMKYLKLFESFDDVKKDIEEICYELTDGRFDIKTFGISKGCSALYVGEHERANMNIDKHDWIDNLTNLIIIYR